MHKRARLEFLLFPVKYLGGQGVIRSFFKKTPVARAVFGLMSISGFANVAVACCSAVVQPDCACFLSGQLCYSKTLGSNNPVRLNACALVMFLIDGPFLLGGINILMSFGLIFLTTTYGVLGLLHFTR